MDLKDINKINILRNFKGTNIDQDLNRVVEIQKAYEKGQTVYSDTSLNRKLNRVGKPYTEAKSGDNKGVPSASSSPKKSLIEHSHEELQSKLDQAHQDFENKKINEVDFDKKVTSIQNAIKSKKEGEKEASKNDNEDNGVKNVNIKIPLKKDVIINRGRGIKITIPKGNIIITKIYEKGDGNIGAATLTHENGKKYELNSDIIKDNFGIDINSEIKKPDNKIIAKNLGLKNHQELAILGFNAVESEDKELLSALKKAGYDAENKIYDEDGPFPNYNLSENWNYNKEKEKVLNSSNSKEEGNLNPSKEKNNEDINKLKTKKPALIKILESLKSKDLSNISGKELDDLLSKGENSFGKSKLGAFYGKDKEGNFSLAITNPGLSGDPGDHRDYNIGSLNPKTKVFTPKENKGVKNDKGIKAATMFLNSILNN